MIMVRSSSISSYEDQINSRLSFDVVFSFQCNFIGCDWCGSNDKRQVIDVVFSSHCKWPKMISSHATAIMQPQYRDIFYNIGITKILFLDSRHWQLKWEYPLCGIVFDRSSTIGIFTLMGGARQELQGSFGIRFDAIVALLTQQLKIC